MFLACVDDRKMSVIIDRGCFVLLLVDESHDSGAVLEGEKMRVKARKKRKAKRARRGRRICTIRRSGGG